MPFATMSSLGLLPLEIRRMLRSVRRFHAATLQDRDLRIAFLHNSYAVGIMDVLRDLADDETIQSATGVDIRELRNEILAVQDSLERKALKLMGHNRRSQRLLRVA